ncbi:hypothetical protein V6N13_080877 [Hibiscus sabdariffa]
MEKILERYERHSYAESQLVAIETQPQGNWSVEYNRLKARVELLQKNHRTNSSLSFRESFVKGRDYDPDRERAERKKLRKLVNREAKGAVRELRKDNYFLYDVKQRDKELLEQERAAKYGRAMAFLQEQEHAFKSGQLGKGSRKRKK